MISDRKEFRGEVISKKSLEEKQYMRKVQKRSSMCEGSKIGVVCEKGIEEVQFVRNVQKRYIWERSTREVLCEKGLEQEQYVRKVLKMSSMWERSRRGVIYVKVQNRSSKRSRRRVVCGKDLGVVCEKGLEEEQYVEKVQNKTSMWERSRREVICGKGLEMVWQDRMVYSVQELSKVPGTYLN